MMSADPHHTAHSARARYWLQTRLLTVLLLAFWAALVFGTLFFARELATIDFFGWNLSFYMLAQGLTLSFVLILAVYSVGMRWIAYRYGKD
jgi:putative solute:sodium symporter small subunit